MSDTDHATNHGHDPQSPYCLNCHYTLPVARPRYCGHCGQETDLHPPSVREMLTEYLGHYVALDGPLWRTLWALVMIPGHLTLAYFHGRRRRYVLPLRVYLSASFLFFVGAHLLNAHSGHKPGTRDDRASLVQRDAHPAKTGPRGAASAAGAASDSEATSSTTNPDPKLGSESRVEDRADEDNGTDTAKAAIRDTDRAVRAGLSNGLKVQHAEASASEPGCDLDHVNDSCSTGEKWLAGLVDKAEHMTRAQWEAKLWALAPYGMLTMQPFFAALLLLMFAGSGRRYAEHFVFSLHSHSLWFLALLLVNAGVSSGLMMLAVFWHGTLALRRVYGLGAGGAFWRGLLLSMGYFLLLALGMILLLGLIAMLG